MKECPVDPKSRCQFTRFFWWHCRRCWKLKVVKLYELNEALGYQRIRMDDLIERVKELEAKKGWQSIL